RAGRSLGDANVSVKPQGRPGGRGCLTHAVGQVEEHVVAAQAAQEVEEAADGGAAGAAALPVLQQRGGGVGPRLQPPDLQVLAAQLLRQRRPVGGRRRPRVEVEAEAAPHAVVQRHHGHSVEVGPRRDGAGAGAGARRRRGHGSGDSRGPFASRLAPPRRRPPSPGRRRRALPALPCRVRGGRAFPAAWLEVALPRKEANGAGPSPSPSAPLRPRAASDGNARDPCCVGGDASAMQGTVLSLTLFSPFPPRNHLRMATFPSSPLIRQTVGL
uniref:Uncharacterized protein n=1 Tax=Strix occidentalis caurina TaxID=311401 RepID=A0A8D0FRZ7_STROC